MLAAIENFSKLNQSNKMVVLGDMLELGEETDVEHFAVLELLKQKNITNVILVGTHFLQAGKNTDAKIFATSDEAAHYCKEQKFENYTILIKGSRGIKLEKVVEEL